MAGRLRVGVIGLGRRWARYRRVLARQQGPCRVRAVYDPSFAVAEREAGQLGCSAVGGVVELMERKDVEAVLLLDPGWQGLWPVEQACRLGKPVLCATLPAGEAGRIGPLCRGLSQGGPPVVMALAPRFWRLVLQVWFLLERRLGPARLLRLHWTGTDTHSHRPALEAPLLLPMLMACRELFESDPETVRVAGVPAAPGHAGLILGYPEGQVAELSVWRGPAYRPTCRIEFVADKGGGVAELPDEVRWQDAEGRHHRRLGTRAAEEEVLERFGQSLLGRVDAGPTLGEVEAALGWLGRAREAVMGGVAPGSTRS